MTRTALSGAFYAVFGMFPAAALVALMYRFPIPLAGFRSGIRAACLSPWAVLYLWYHECTSLLLLMFGGAIGGLIAYTIRGPDRRAVHVLCLSFALGFALLAAFLVAVSPLTFGFPR